jgi:alkaline phosphatase D
MKHAHSAVDRRGFLRLAGGLAGLAALAQATPDVAFARTRWGSDPFTLGVASGDPRPDGVVLWTRLAPKPFEPDGGMPSFPVPVRWVVARDDRMRRVERQGLALAWPRLAHSVHVEVHGLDPNREYFYQFHVGGEESPIGRTRTAPAPHAHVERLRFAFASCQKWDDGYFSAYRRMAEEDLDFVVHLGDYIYEYGIGATVEIRDNVAVPEQFRPETTDLARYRIQYALYKSDPDLQAAHARFPWIVTPDDHEVENDYADEISEEPSQPPAVFVPRRAAAYQAFYEHLPLRRTSLPRGPDMLLYRRLRFGDLAEFSVLDTRQYRSDHPCGDGETARCAAALDPSKTMTGPEQERWLLDGLSKSSTRWNVIAQQVMMGELLHRTKPEKQYWNDAWDGYPAARARVLQHIASRQIRNPMVITGDWHSTFVNDLKLDFTDPKSKTVATEFVGTSISSNGDGIVYGPYYGPMVPLNPHIKFFDGDRRGYVRCTVDREHWRSDLRMVSTVSRSDAPISTFASFVVESGKAGAVRV